MKLLHKWLCPREATHTYRLLTKPEGLAATVCRNCKRVWIFEAALIPAEVDALNNSSVLRGRVVEADGPAPRWKPEQHGSVIMQEPDLVRAERERDEAVQ